MSRYTQGACPKCSSSDAFTIYEDTGWGQCYSCDVKLPPEKVNEIMGNNDSATTSELNNGSNNSNSSILNNSGSNPSVSKESIIFNTSNPAPQSGTLERIAKLPTYEITKRKISREVADRYGVKMDINTKSQFYPYTRQDKGIVAYKERKEPKSFVIHGEFKDVQLFGQANAFIGNKSLVITEGELDCLAVAEAFKQKYNKAYAVVSIPSATGMKALLEQREWVKKFESVILMFDQDDAGKKATEQAAKIIGPTTKVAILPAKDPCEVLIKFGVDTLVSCFFNAQTYSPAGILVGEQIWEKYIERKNVESIPYPECLPGLNDKLKGMRQGEITLFTSGTGIGKSTITKEIILHLLSTTDSKIGIISLEESIGDTTEQLINMHLKTTDSTDEENRKAFEDVFADERIVLLDHQGSVSDASLTDKIEYMALMGCTHLFLDHITIAVSEGTEGLTGNEAVDKMMSDLLKIVKKHNVWLGLVSHLRKSMSGKAFEEGHLPTIDDIKGSGSIKQISFDIIAFARNQQAKTEEEKRLTKFAVLKSRFTGLTGPSGIASYDLDTRRMIPVEKDFTSIE